MPRTHTPRRRSTTNCPELDTARYQAEWMLAEIGYLAPVRREVECDEFWQAVDHIAEKYFDYTSLTEDREAHIRAMPREQSDDAQNLFIDLESAKATAAYLLGIAVGMRVKSGAQ